MTINKEPQIVATLTDKGLNLVVDGEPTTLNSSHLNFERVLTALRNKDYVAIPPMLDVAKAVVAYCNGLVKIEHGVVSFNGVPMDNSLTKRMLEMVSLGIDISHYAKFLERLQQNPSKRSVEQLYSFMEACDLPITEDGRLLCYKSVNSNYWDTHTGKTALNLPPNVTDYKSLVDLSWGTNMITRNGVDSIFQKGRGSIIKMQRNRVNDNPDQTCSHGLHVCSQAYGMFGARLLLVAVDPADVVSVPRDYNAAKMRVCQYEVLKDVQKEGFETFEGRPVWNGAWDDVEDEDVDWEY